MPTYNKLVRDLIPQLIEGKGKSLETYILSNEDYQTELREKLQEEVQEYLEAEDQESAIEELADILELVSILSEQHGSTIGEVDQIRKEKAEERGSFYDKVYLVSIED